MLPDLLQTINSNDFGAYDFREHKTGFFLESKDALQDFVPLEPGLTNSNNIQVVDFFSGAGGASLGFAAINKVCSTFSFLAGCDIDPVSAATYSKNFGTPAICEDILKISDTPEKIQEFLRSIGFDKAKKSILIGCAPCQGFSSHGKKRWNKEDDERNNLVSAFARIVVETDPTAFVMENVPEFLSGKYWDYFGRAREAFRDAEYIVKQSIYNAADFGVSQERFRSVVIGMKKEFLLPDGVYEKAHYRTVRNAIAGLLPVSAGESDPADNLHKAVAHKKSTIDIIKKVPHDGGNLPKGEGPQCLTRVKGFSDVYGRLSWDKPAITITHYARNPASGRYTHPDQDRGLTAREAARLQGFPDAFQFEGRSDDIYRQIGEAVPPLLSCGVAVNMLIELLSCEPTENQISASPASVDLPVSNSYSSVIAGIKNTRKRA